MKFSFKWIPAEGESAQAHKEISGLMPRLWISSFSLSHLYFSNSPPSSPHLKLSAVLVFVLWVISAAAVGRGCVRGKEVGQLQITYNNCLFPLYSIKNL